MPAKKAAKKAAAKKEAPAKEVPAVTPDAPAAKEVPAKKAARKAAKKTASKAGKVVPQPPKDVAKAAYLNSLARKAKGLPADPVADWLDAEKSEGA